MAVRSFYLKDGAKMSREGGDICGAYQDARGCSRGAKRVIISKQANWTEAKSGPAPAAYGKP